MESGETDPLRCRSIVVIVIAIWRIIVDGVLRGRSVCIVGWWKCVLELFLVQSILEPSLERLMVDKGVSVQ